MNAPDLEKLIAKYLDHTASEEELAALSALLEKDSDARRAYLRIADLHATLAADPSVWAQEPAFAPETGAMAACADSSGPVVCSRRSWWSWLALVPKPAVVTLLALGLLAGFLIGATAYAVNVRMKSKAPAVELPLVDGGFESGPAPEAGGVPLSSGLWSGDFNTVVEQSGSIQPHSGRKMLQFLRADNRHTFGDKTSASELWQIVDVRSLRSLVRDGEAVAELSLWVSCEEMRCRFGAGLLAFSGNWKNPDLLWQNRRSLALATAEKDEPYTFRPGQWHRLSTQITVPPDTDFLMMCIRVNKGSSNPTGVAEFTRCFADDVTLRLLPKATP